MQLMLCVSAALAVTVMVMVSVSDTLALCLYLPPCHPQGILSPTKRTSNQLRLPATWFL